MHPPKCVLIVEPSADDREVLRTALERRGLRILEAAEPQAGLQLAREHQPSVIVLELDGQASDEGLPAAFDSQVAGDDHSVIILGKARRSDRLPADQVIAKPYYFGPLVRKIEELAAKAA
jgi:CheY-like chemotaxis protein